MGTGPIDCKPLRPIVLLRHLLQGSNLLFNCFTIGSFISDLNPGNGERDHVSKHSLEPANYKRVTNVIFIHKKSMVA